MIYHNEKLFEYMDIYKKRIKVIAQEGASMECIFDFFYKRKDCHGYMNQAIADPKIIKMWMKSREITTEYQNRYKKNQVGDNLLKTLRKKINTIDKNVTKFNKEREKLMQELNKAMDGRYEQN